MLSYKQIEDAWKYIKQKNAAGGADHLTIEQFTKNENLLLKKIHQLLIEKKYLPEGYLHIKLKKEKKEFRNIALATINDKIVQQAVKTKIENRIENDFSNLSYAYIKGKGALKAINRTRNIIQNENKKWIAKCDIDNFFDTLDHQLLFNKLKKYIADDYCFELIKMFVKMGYVKNGNKWQDRTKGVPQGAILSPLLANLYLNDLDWFTVKNKISYIRYADDFVILSPDENKAKQDLDKVVTYIKENLKLKLNDNYYIRHIDQGFKFLGLWISNEQVSISDKKIQKLINKINAGFTHPDFPKKYNETLAGINNYYGRLLPQHHFFRIDEFIHKLWKNKIKREKKLRSKKAIRKKLKNLKYLTDYYNQKIDYHKERMIDDLFEYFTTKKITTAEQAVRKRKRQYEQKSNKNSYIYIHGYGISLGISKKRISIKEKGKPVKKIGTQNLKNIVIASAATSISSKLIKFCAKNNIAVDFVNNTGKVYAKLFNPNNLQNNFWLTQQKHIQSDQAYITATEIVNAKIKNQEKIIKYFSKYAKKTEKDIAQSLPEILNKLKQYREKLYALEHKEIEKFRQKTMAIEGLSSTEYWRWFRMMIDEETDFAGREHQGATDPVNSMLNYGYAILYRLVWTSVVRYGLYAGFSYIHTPHKHKGTLVFDLIEPFRQTIIDRAVISLINRKIKLKIDNKGLLDKETKTKLINAVNKNLGRYDTYLGERQKMTDIINIQTRELKKYINNQTKRFKPYQLSKW